MIVRFWMYSGGGFGTLVGSVGLGVASLSSFARGEAIGGYGGREQVEVILGMLATRSEDSYMGLPRLYETVVQEGQGGGWKEDMVGG
jgi:hypothetical protein